MEKACTKCEQTLELELFQKDNRRAHGRGSHCKSCHNVINRLYRTSVPTHLTWDARNIEASRSIKLKHRHKEGSGVYAAEYQSGIYIGSGYLKGRSTDHLNGHARIGRTLGEKAIEFKVLLICSRDNLQFYEQAVIDHYGIESLLNERRITI